MMPNIGPSNSSLLTAQAAREATNQALNAQVEQAVNECAATIETATRANRSWCYCRRNGQDVSEKVKEELERREYSVTPCYVKVKFCWENEHDPYGETISETETAETFYITWGSQNQEPQSRFGWLKSWLPTSTINKCISHKTECRRADWIDRGRFDILDIVNEKN